MNWRDVARAVRSADVSADDGCNIGNSDNIADSSCADAEACADAFAERVAIAVIDGGLPPEWATALSLLERRSKPEGISEKDWRKRLDLMWRRAADHGADFAANGWDFQDVFGLGDHWARLDHRGAAWLAAESQIVEITPHQCIYALGRSRLSHHKQGRVH